MLDSTDNNIKLLKMKERLLKVTSDSLKTIDINSELYNETLNRFKLELDAYISIAKDVSNNSCQLLFDKVKNYDYNHTLVEEYEILDDILSEFEQIEMLQCKIRNLCEEYGSDKLELNDLNIIDVDKMKERKNLISGYLLALKNVDSTKGKLVELSNNLSLESLNREDIIKKLLYLEDSLVDSFLNAEGRMIGNNAEYVYTSVMDEYKNIGVDLYSIQKDISLLDNLLLNTTNDRNEKNELLKAAEVCYNSMPNKENKITYDQIKDEYNKVTYRLCLLKIANLIFNKYDDYDKVKEKREQILDLVNWRLKCLNEMKIRYFVDPFSRIKIDSQLEIIENTEDNANIIKRIRNAISETDQSLAEYISQRKELLEQIDATTGDKFISSVIEEKEDNILDDVVVSENAPLVIPNDNKVISIKDISDKFKKDIVSSKTTGVIKRVNSMFNKKEEPVIEQESNPTIFIESSYNDIFDDSVVDENKDVPELASELNFDISNFPTLDVSTAVTDSDNNNDDMTISIDIPDEKIEKDVIEDTSSEVSNISIENKEEVADDIFMDVTPFEDIVLFNNKNDDAFVFPEVDNNLSVNNIEDLTVKDNSISVSDLSNEMPDVFWNLSSDDNSSGGMTESFDESIDELLNGEIKSKEKVRKLVA